MLHIEHRREITVFKLHYIKKMIGLLFGRSVNTIKMIGTTGKTILTSLIEILTEILVCLGSALSSLDHYKTHGTLVDHAIVLQFFPVDMSLMMGDINAVNLVTSRIADISIEGAPSESKR